MIPTFDTDRLSFRGFRRDDFDASLAMWSEPSVVRFIGGRPFTGEEVWARLMRYLGHWELLGFGFWVVTDRATGRFVGEVGFADFRRDTDVVFHGTPEVGWVLAPWAHGRGLATEAVRAVQAWGDEHFAGGRTVCIIDPEHVASLRVAQKTGFVETGRIKYKEQPLVLLERNV